ncbi:MAG: transcription antitermination factor NusB [Acidobacteria bacterium]|nr:transcription antitermination factor NusB [Acidobacteriota bacterium]
MSELGAGRHRSRARALELLYEAAMKDRPVLVVASQLPVPPDDYTAVLLAAVSAHEGRAIELISAFSIDWSLDRMALIDRLVLTLATSEILMDDAPPTAVIMDEAVELAKTYSTDASPSFVNGVLSSIVEELTTRE